MSIKRLHLTLFANRDADLIALSLCDGIKIGTVIKRALILFINNEPFKINIPEQIPSIPKDVSRKDVIIVFNLENEKERNVIKFLDACKSREKFNVIKMIVRKYFSTVLLTPFLEENGKEMLKKILENQNDNIETPVKEIQNDDATNKKLLLEIRALLQNKAIQNLPTQQEVKEVEQIKEAPKKKIIIDTAATKTQTNEDVENIEENDSFDLWSSIDKMMTF